MIRDAHSPVIFIPRGIGEWQFVIPRGLGFRFGGKTDGDLGERVPRVPPGIPSYDFIFIIKVGSEFYKLFSENRLK